MLDGRKASKSRGWEVSMVAAGESVESRVKPAAFGCITIPFLLIALVPLAWGARSQWTKGTLLRNGEIVTGMVTELRHVPGNPSAGRQISRGGRVRGESPVVAFTTRAGQMLSCVGSVNRYPVQWKTGDVVDIVYDPADPTHADLRSELSGWGLWFAVWCAVALLPLTIASAPVALWLRDRSSAISILP
jgi:hypothetical protein